MWCIFNCPPPPTPIGEVIREMRFEELDPFRHDSSLLGSLVGVAKFDSGEARRSVLCNPALHDRDLLKQDQNFFRDKTVDLKYAERVQAAGHLTLSAGFSALLQSWAEAAPNYAHIKNISVTIDHAYSLWTDEAALGDIAKKLLSIPSCADSYANWRKVKRQYDEQRVEQPQDKSRIPDLQLNLYQSILMASISYSIDIDSSASLEARASTISTMEAQLGASYDKGSHLFKTGEDMAIGYNVSLVTPLP
jgi:hypothetical protein